MEPGELGRDRIYAVRYPFVSLFMRNGSSLWVGYTQKKVNFKFNCLITVTYKECHK